MSGELRLSGATMTTLVKSLALLAERVPTTEFAVIGGLAVLARLEGAHRVTDDLDTVAEQHGDEPSVVDAVVSADGIDGFLAGTKIDCIAVGDVPAAQMPSEQLPDAEEDRMFVLAHRWALDTAETCTVEAGEEGSGFVHVQCRFASPAGLVAMKLQSAPRRRSERIHKAGGDYLDVFRLISHPTMTRTIALSLRSAPHDLGPWCLRAIERSMVTDAERTLGVISRSGAAESYRPSAAQMRRAGEMVIDLSERGP